MTYYIYSTHTNSITYVEYEDNPFKKHNIVKRRFTVAGGHGLCNKNLVTPQGIITRVDRDEDMEWLNTLDSFTSDIRNGYIKVMKRKEDPEKVVSRDMVLKDGSSPKTPSEYKIIDKETNSYSSAAANYIL